MKRGKILLSLLAAGLSVAAWAAEITGTVAYREKMAIPSHAVVVVKLEEIGPADAPSKLVSELRFTAFKQVPLAFKFSYIDDPKKSKAVYNIRSSIEVGGQLLFTTTEAVRVVPGRNTKVNLMLHRVATPPSPILGATWMMVDLGGKSAIPGGRGTPYIRFDSDGKQYVGFTGVNQLSGSFSITGNNIKIKPGRQTLVASSQDLMDQEKAFKEALEEATSYRVMDGKLELIKGSKILARFEKEG